MTNTPKAPSITVDVLLSIYLKPEHAVDPTLVKFLKAYIECRHVGEAAKAVGIKTASGHNILKKKDVAKAMAEITVNMSQVENFNGQEILERTNEIAQYDPIDVFNADGTVRDISDIPPAVRRAVKSMTVKEVWEKDINGISVETGRIVKIEFYDKLKGLEMIGKYDGVYNHTVKHEMEIGTNLAALLLGKAESRAIEASRDVGGDRTESKRGNDIYVNRFLQMADKVKVDTDE